MNKFMILIILGLLSVGCCKENTSPTQNILHGKLKTFEDDYYKGIISPDSVIKFYFNYDSLNGSLENVTIHIQFNNLDTIIPIFNIYNNIDGNIYVYMNFFMNALSQTPRKFKINTVGKRITSIIEIDSINNTERIVAKSNFTGNTLDSAYNLGFFPRTNVNYYNFVYANQNCTSYSINYDEYLLIPPYFINRSSQIKIDYSNYILNTNLFLQNCMEISSFNEYGLLLFILNVDEYYITPKNYNLLSRITENTSNHDTLITNYNYYFTGSDVTNLKRTSFYLSDTTIKTVNNQIITYY